MIRIQIFYSIKLWYAELWNIRTELMLNFHKIDSQYKDIEKVNKLALEAFPKEEYLAPSEIIELSKDGSMNFLAVYNESEFIGFTVAKLYKTMSYLFFLAIDKKHRGLGFGSKIIRELKELYSGYNQVVDFEMVDKKAKNYEQRVKRKNFYLKNGYKENYDILMKMALMYEKLGDLLRANQYYKKAFLVNSKDESIPDKIRELESLRYRNTGYYSKRRKK